MSIGRPTKGRLYNGVQVPETDYYDVRRPDEAWGSSHTVLQLQTAIATFRRNVYLSGDRGRSWRQVAEDGRGR